MKILQRTTGVTGDRLASRRGSTLRNIAGGRRARPLHSHAGQNRGHLMISLDTIEALAVVVAGLGLGGLAAALITGYVAGRSRLKRARQALRRHPRRSGS
jgi:hypothetical protein